MRGVLGAITGGIGPAVAGVIKAGQIGIPAATSTASATSVLGASTRLSQDIAVNPKPPVAMKPAGRTVGQSATQNNAVTEMLEELGKLEARDVRVNQQQVNFDGVRVGVNRPDLQYSLNGQRYYVEWDIAPAPRAGDHEVRISANDPDGIVTLITTKD